jgi:hypothetical protein
MLGTLFRSSRFICACIIGLVLALALKVYLSMGGVFVGFWLPAVFGVGWLLLCRPLVKQLPRRAGIVALVLFLAALSPLGLPWDSRERFVRDLSRVDPGMTPGQVDAILGCYISGSGWSANPFVNGNPSGDFAVRGCKIFRHCDHCNFSSDWGIVCFERGLVSRVDFSPD